MVRLAFVLLAHGDPVDVGRLIRALAGAGHHVVVHYDLKAPAANFARLMSEFGDVPAVRFAGRVTVAWGEWSVVQATLNCLTAIQDAGWEPDYVYLVSGMDYPIRPSEHLLAFLDRNRGDEFIETIPADTEKWVKTGPQRERYLYHWPFNWRENKLITELLYDVQKWMGVTRAFPDGLIPFMGSQWWVLTWRTLTRILGLARLPDLVSFFRTTLVPDELFFQTLVRHVAESGRIIDCPLTLYQFSDYGYPVVFEADHYDYLSRQNFFFARKIGMHLPALRDRLDRNWSGEAQMRPFPDERVGLLTTDYEDRRLAYRNGPPGRPVPGRSQGKWHENQKRVRQPWFALLGTSTAELGIVHDALAPCPELLCHGQVFHPERVELARGLDGFAGYGPDDMRMRDVSAPNFVTDLVLAETTRRTGILLRRGQGWHMAELAFDRPHVAVVIVEGDLLIAFCEALFGSAPLLDERIEPDMLRDVPAEAASLTFRRLLGEHRDHAQWLDRQFEKGARAKPAGWMLRIDPRDPPRDWLPGLAGCLGVTGALAPDTTEALDRLAALREASLRLLDRAGVSRLALEQLKGRRGLGLAAELI
jgi:hypothetical protein